jgi:hypothetical protein
MGKDTPLMGAAEHGHQEIVSILLTSGANVNKVNSEGKTALSLAAEKGHLEIVKLLLAAGADIYACTNNLSETPLGLLAAKNKQAIYDQHLAAPGDPIFTPPVLRSTTLRPALRSTTLRPALRSTTLRPALRSTTLRPALRSTTLRPALRKSARRSAQHKPHRKHTIISGTRNGNITHRNNKSNPIQPGRLAGPFGRD